MKNESFTKRILSFVLCAVMLVSCWVFTAPVQANAANNTAAGTYDVYITFNVTDTADSWFGDGYGSGYTYDSKTDGDRVGITVFYKNNNGWGTESHADFDLYPSSGTKPIKTSGVQNTGTTFFDIGFPTSIYAYNDHGNLADGTNYKITKVQVKKHNAATDNYVTIFQGNLVAGASNTGIKYCWLQSDGTHTQDGGSVEDNKGWTSLFPYVKSGGTLSRAADIVLDGENDKSCLITKADATDQYGVTYAAANCTLSRTCSYSSSYITIDGNYLKATKNAHISSTNVNEQDVTVTGTWQGSKKVKKTVTVKITDEKYLATWYYTTTNEVNLDAPITTNSETSYTYYGDYYKDSAPTVTNYYYTSSQHFTGGTFTVSNPTWANGTTANKEITMAGYTAADHVYTDHYVEVEGNDTVHKAYCSCGYFKTDDEQSNHRYGDWAEVDATTHQRICSRCDHVETGTHTFTSWSVTVPEDATLAAAMKADYDSSLECFRYCTKCYRVEYRAHNYLPTVTLEPTCLAAGNTTYTCEHCSDTYIDLLAPAALGHHWALNDSSNPTDGSSGHRYYECDRCSDYYTLAVYDEDTKSLRPATEEESTPTQRVSEVESNPQSQVPAPTFDAYTDPTIGNYHYHDRKASLKLGGSTADTTQALRFAGSIDVPAGVSYDVDPTARAEDVDNVILDFGYIYTQLNYHNIRDEADPDEGIVLYEPNNETFKLNGDQVYQMSVVERNADRGTFSSGTWKGVSHHTDRRSGTDIDVLTFNLVIDVSQANYKQTYLARPYIIYKYHGETYTIYDVGIQQRDVFFVAYKTTVVSSSNTKVVDFLNAKVLSHDSEILPDLKWISTLNTYFDNQFGDNFFDNGLLEYLRYEVDEETGEPVRDEDGNLVPQFVYGDGYDYVYNGRNYGDDVVLSPLYDWQ